MRTDITLNQKRILELLRDAGHTQAFIAKALGIHQSAVSNMFNGTRTMKLSEAEELLKYIPGAKPVRTLPVIGMAGAGNWIEAIENPAKTIEIPPDIYQTAKFAVTVQGDSMNLMLPEGSEAIVDTDQTELFVGKLYLLRNDDGEATIKRYRADPARFEPVSDNLQHQPFALGKIRFDVIGRVVGGLQTF